MLTEKVRILDNFGINGSYNLLAKEYALSNIGFNLASRVKDFDINMGGSFDPYLYVADPLFLTSVAERQTTCSAKGRA